MSTTTKSATFAGLLSVLFWSMSAVIIFFSKGVHPFLFAGFEHFIGFLCFCAIWIVRKENPIPILKSIPAWFYGIATMGVVLHTLTWIVSIRSVPPLEATLIIYTWPLMVVIFTSISLKEKLYWFHYAACVIGFLGIFFMLSHKGLSLSEFSFKRGHVLAIICALSWSIYSAVAARQKHLNSYIYAVVYIVSAIVNTSIWLIVYEAPKPNFISMFIITCVGITSTIGYILWDYGMKRGDSRLIGTASFLTPVLSTSFLILAGQGAFDYRTVLSLCLVMSGIFLVKYGPKFFQKNKE